MEGFFHLGNKEACEKAIIMYQKQSCLDKNRNNQMKINLFFFDCEIFFVLKILLSDKRSVPTEKFQPMLFFFTCLRKIADASLKIYLQI